jgi:hypothetical protein
MPDRTVNLELPAHNAEAILARLLPQFKGYVVTIEFTDSAVDLDTEESLPAFTPADYEVLAVQPDARIGYESAVLLAPWVGEATDYTGYPDRAAAFWVAVSDIATLAVI